MCVYFHVCVYMCESALVTPFTTLQSHLRPSAGERGIPPHPPRACDDHAAVAGVPSGAGGINLCRITIVEIQIAIRNHFNN
jgi:hypothetical protein